MFQCFIAAFFFFIIAFCLSEVKCKINVYLPPFTTAHTRGAYFLINRAA